MSAKMWAKMMGVQETLKEHVTEMVESYNKMEDDPGNVNMINNSFSP